MCLGLPDKFFQVSRKGCRSREDGSAEGCVHGPACHLVQPGLNRLDPPALRFLSFQEQVFSAWLVMTSSRPADPVA